MRGCVVDGWWCVWVMLCAMCDVVYDVVCDVYDGVSGVEGSGKVERLILCCFGWWTDRQMDIFTSRVTFVTGNKSHVFSFWLEPQQ